MKHVATKTLAGALLTGALVVSGNAYAEGQKAHEREAQQSAQRQKRSATKESESMAKKRTEKLREVSGTVIDLKDVDIKGADTKNTVALLKTTKNNRRLVVDLGPKEQAKGIKKGEKISAQGVVVTLRGEPVLVANNIQDDGRTMRVQRMSQFMQHRKDGNQ